MLHLYAALAEKERRVISHQGGACCQEGAGRTARRPERQRRQEKRAEGLRKVFTELAGISARSIAAELNKH
jgi:CRISPR/Cas system-associated protein Csm6